MKVSYRVVAGLLMLGFSGMAVAEDGAKFEEHKAQVLRNIDQEISILQEKKSCVSGASNGEAIKACHEKVKAARNQLATQRKEVRAQKIDAQIQKLQEKKTEMQAPSKK